MIHSEEKETYEVTMYPTLTPIRIRLKIGYLVQKKSGRRLKMNYYIMSMRHGRLLSEQPSFDCLAVNKRREGPDRGIEFMYKNKDKGRLTPPLRKAVSQNYASLT